MMIVIVTPVVSVVLVMMVAVSTAGVVPVMT